VNCCKHGDDSSGSVKSGEFLDCLGEILLQAVGELDRPLAAAVKRRAQILIPCFGHYISKLNLLIRAFFFFGVVAAVFCDVMSRRNAYVCRLQNAGPHSFGLIRTLIRLRRT